MPLVYSKFKEKHIFLDSCKSLLGEGFVIVILAQISSTKSLNGMSKIDKKKNNILLFIVLIRNR